MSKFLKGNYEVKQENQQEDKEKTEDYSELFESEAFEQLGGSIAFVMKSNKFVWDDEEEGNENAE
ncbi:MAG: hypothetical protein KAJ10_04310 [Thermodesulfovibrionia bacterium]|nr:hypothetical protein [Thermodesulfovibrionia bacterium]